MILVSLALTALLAATGLVIDGGKLYMTQSHLQKTANASALSGAQKLLTSEAATTTIVKETLYHHEELPSLEQVSFGQLRVKVDLEKQVPLSFSGLIGNDSSTVTVDATAGLGTMGAATGAVPLGIDRSFNLEYYKEYELKTDTTGSDTGWFGILALGGPGAATYYDNFINGYQHEIQIGNVIDTETGNVAGKTREAINERINNCPYSMEQAIDKNCSRIILVPVYEPYNVQSNQIKQVKITGFAYFYITEPTSGKETSVHGMFIKKAGPGKIDEHADNRGAFSIRLLE